MGNLESSNSKWLAKKNLQENKNFTPMTRHSPEKKQEGLSLRGLTARKEGPHLLAHRTPGCFSGPWKVRGYHHEVSLTEWPIAESSIHILEARDWNQVLNWDVVPLAFRVEWFLATPWLLVATAGSQCPLVSGYITPTSVPVIT